MPKKMAAAAAIAAMMRRISPALPLDPGLFAQYVLTAYLPIYFVFAGAVTEAVRRYKARDLE